MNSLLLAVVGLVCSVLWLGLLVATHFSPVIVSLGLLVVLYATGSSTTTRPNPVRPPRSH
jgi:hypothetical protein